jgi:phosphoribosylaminoimidazolecarboxamide formyltransferase/IMP cyclohydrolase
VDALIRIRRALLSVSNKTGLLDLARGLHALGVELLASGGTYHELQKAEIPALEIAAYTGQPQILGGRVKTLHPRIHGGILARRNVPEDLATLDAHGILPIDLVVVNLYPFEQTIARPDCTLEEAIENIDIGGPALIRAAAKNAAHVVVATHPDQYPLLLNQLRDRGGISTELSRRLMLEAFRLTSRYDAAIRDYLDRLAPPAPEADPYPDRLCLTFRKRGSLRYGENPHQSAAFYADEPQVPGTLPSARVLHGKELSYNNLLDLDSALRLVRSFARPAAVVLKHNNPCGAAVADELAVALERAWDGDPVSAFGGIVGFNRPVDRATAECLATPGRFVECILAPEFSPEALELLTTRPSWRQSVRLVAVGTPLRPENPGPPGYDLRRIEGGLLVQDWDRLADDPTAAEVATRRAPSEAERADLDFAWRVCAAVKSNAIVLARDGQVVGVGAGQMSRLDSVRIAVQKAGPRAQGAVLASDAFFPFRDGPDAAAAAGVTAIIQPGGSKRDAETIAACDEHGLAMLLTGRRHFRH